MQNSSPHPDATSVFKYAGPFALDQRTRAVRALANRGEGKIVDFLKIDFGHWPPHGLHSPSPVPDETVLIKNFEDLEKFSGQALSEETKKVGGFVLWPDFQASQHQPSMALNRRHNGFKPQLISIATITSYAAASIGYLSIACFMASSSLVTAVAFAAAPHLILAATQMFESGRKSLNMVLSNAKTEMPDTVTHEFAHVLQMRRLALRGISNYNLYRREAAPIGEHLPPENLEHSLRALLPNAQDSPDEKSAKAKERLHYLLDPCEIQARLHVCVTDAYRRIGHLPENITQFYALMQQQGFQLPPALALEVAQTARLQAGAAFWQGFNKAGTSWKQHYNAADLTELFAEVGKNPEASTQMWQNVLPYLYGDLLELYGNPEGKRQIGIELYNDSALPRPIEPTVELPQPAAATLPRVNAQKLAKPAAFSL